MSEKSADRRRQNVVSRYSVKPEPDWVLRLLLSILEGIDDEAGISLTVSTGGLLVSGVTIPSKAFLTASADLLKSSGASGLEVAFERMRDDLLAAPDDVHAGMPTFVNLKNARFFDPTGHYVPRDQSVLWRCRLSQVDGWFMGQLST